MLGDPDATLHRMQLEWEEYVKERDTEYKEKLGADAEAQMIDSHVRDFIDIADP
jgi:hypothetical protein